MGLIVDNFAGGGGASTGIEQALGRAVDIAINHDEEAIRMHEANHPGTLHIRNNIWQIDPPKSPAVSPSIWPGSAPTANISARRRAASRAKKASATWPGSSCFGAKRVPGPT
jgi:site-specific DNA-cytosine methylase